MSTLTDEATRFKRMSAVLQGWGYSIEYAAGWEGRTNGSTIRRKSAVTVHHTGGTATATSYLLNPADRPALKVLANIHITRNHKIKILAAGSTSHGGYTYQPSYERIVAGAAPLDRDLTPGADSSDFSINTRTIGIEVDGAGGSAEWDTWMVDAVVAVSAAAQTAWGWMAAGGAARVGGHKEHTRRKPGDPYMNMGVLRARVAGKLAKPTAPLVTPPAASSAGWRVAYANLGQQVGWASRKKIVLPFLQQAVKASAYLLTECDIDMAREVAIALGWMTTSARDVLPGAVDENRNAVLADPRKFRDVDVLQTSLSETPGDLADRHYRSACWGLYERDGKQYWLGAAHLSNGATAAAARASQARELIASKPDGRLLLGIDRNSLESSEPARTLTAGGLPLLTPGLGDSFTGNGIQSDVGAIDGLHGVGVALTGVRKLICTGLDHAVIAASVKPA